LFGGPRLLVFLRFVNVGTPKFETMKQFLATETLESLVWALSGLKLSTLVVGWVRALPIAVIVPAFGLPSMPGTLKSALAAMLMVAALPGAVALQSEPSLLLLTAALIDGIALAIPAALGIWIGTMAGSLFDELSSPSQHDTGGGPLEEQSSLSGTLIGLFAIVVFLAQGGPSKLALSLSSSLSPALPNVTRVVEALVNGIGLAVTISAPLVVAAVLLQLGALLVSRASPGEALRTLVLPVQGLLRLVFLALFLEWLLYAIASRR
jgi:type III secretory pathway component EscT